MTKPKKFDKTMRRLLDCGDDGHQPVADFDSYGNPITRCTKCGNLLYPKDTYGSVPSFSGSGTYTTSALGTTSVGYQSGYSTKKPKSMNHLSTASQYINTPVGSVSISDLRAAS